MSIKQRQAFIIKMLNDEVLRTDFLTSDKNFGLSAKDIAFVRAIDREGLARKAAMLQRKRNRLKKLEGDS